MKILLKNSMEFKKLFITKGYTQTSLAKELGVSRSYIYKIINYGASIGPELAKKICELFGMEFEDIFFINMLANESKTAWKEINYE